MVLNNLLHHGEPQSSSIFFAVTDEGLEQLTANNFRNAASVVDDTDFDASPDFAQSHMNLAGLGSNRLAGIQQQVVQCALQLSGVEPSRTVALLIVSDTNRVEFWMRPYRRDHALDRIFDVSVSWPQR